MARNSKRARAKERRSRRPPNGSPARPGVATARAQRERAAADRTEDTALDPIEDASQDSIEDQSPDPLEHAGRDRIEDTAPDPLEHATPGVELAEAQLARGRPEPADDAQLGAAELERAELASEEAGPDDQGGERELRTGAGGGGGRHGAGAGVGLDGDGIVPPSGGGGELVVPGASAPERRVRASNRLVTFIQGSWHELQRVQWPDRRQVMQATGVVIGFVIVAGAFLGVADLLATKIVKLILK
ncbi:MAG: preprotein translocase subunit SecE [Solirubrobacteraceae bacterium]